MVPIGINYTNMHLVHYGIDYEKVLIILIISTNNAFTNVACVENVQTNLLYANH